MVIANTVLESRAHVGKKDANGFNKISSTPHTTQSIESIFTFEFKQYTYMDTCTTATATVTAQSTWMSHMNVAHMHSILKKYGIVEAKNPLVREMGKSEEKK